MSSRPQSQRDPAAARKFVEDFALILHQAGMQRMPSRVLSALLVSETGSMTAGDIAESLQISPAAVSGAVRYLAQVGLVRRTREPGERRDHYVIGDDSWYEVLSHKDRVYRHLAEVLERGAASVGEDSEAGRRLAETREFFAYLGKEIPMLIDRWREMRAQER
ncbi:GbsR/MarR family transcriptional regulator [Amycolatopsis suaedae]|uniref:MarR family transcriptional regulator n=1 Tax=Amycolatopsis suaedae TaxID=2510978 RepID=A0A4Q7JDD6_9PSEU|nr:MarR family transcriptional regulator [Amycolatopsis suaedae]RZQ65367.1 MarR family transcriptional regulator [Amycolatopsis suaedae]